MLKKQYRVTNERDIKKVYKKGLFGQGEYLKLNVLQNRRDLSRIAVIVSKKTEKGAVKRNRIKRLTREVVKEIYSTLSEGYDIIINIKQEALRVKKEELKKDLVSTLQKLKVSK